MNRFFYPRLAAQNLRKNKTIYLPYLLAAGLIIGLYYILSSLIPMVSASGMRGGVAMLSILGASKVICAFFSLLILYYINSFVIKRRKKEFGLYSILGMEKRHISLVMFWEVVLTVLISLVVGIGGGALLSQLMFLVLLKLVAIPATLTFQIPLAAVGETAILFAAAFGAILIYDIVSIFRSDPIGLLRAGSTGEREPKARWLLTLIGLAALGSGYWMALSVKRPSDAIAVFLLAVLLVIIGTYALFIAGSIVVLKLMRKKKSFYYKPKNFISVSGMIYRMKQNAAGLASICILSTAVLVTMSSTVCLYIGEEEMLKVNFPREVAASCIPTDQTPQGMQEASALMRETAEGYAEANGFTLKGYIGYTTVRRWGDYDGDTLALQDENGFTGNLADAAYSINLAVGLLSEYNAVSSSSFTLSPGEVLVRSPVPVGDSITIRGANGSAAYTVKGMLPEDLLGIDHYNTLYMAVPDEAALLELLGIFGKDSAGDSLGSFNCRSFYDIEGDGDRATYFAGMREAYLGKVERVSTIRNIDGDREDFYQMYGSLFFVGLFFVVLFISATVLIIYYKQITEGYDDHDRFQIMQNVGMSEKEVRSAISRQVLMVFFLPLGTACLHIAVAFPALCKVLEVFDMCNHVLFFACVAGTVLLFTLIYTIVYNLTARTYFKIVR